MARARNSNHAETPKQNAASPRTAMLRFDPLLFFETAAQGRSISTHHKNEIIFSQGDAAYAVFYIKKGKEAWPSCSEIRESLITQGFLEEEGAGDGLPAVRKCRNINAAFSRCGTSASAAGGWPVSRNS